MNIFKIGLVLVLLFAGVETFAMEDMGRAMRAAYRELTDDIERVIWGPVVRLKSAPERCLTPEGHFDEAYVSFFFSRIIKVLSADDSDEVAKIIKNQLTIDRIRGSDLALSDSEILVKAQALCADYHEKAAQCLVQRQNYERWKEEQAEALSRRVTVNLGHASDVDTERSTMVDKSNITDAAPRLTRGQKLTRYALIAAGSAAVLALIGGISWYLIDKYKKDSETEKEMEPA